VRNLTIEGACGKRIGSFFSTPVGMFRNPHIIPASFFAFPHTRGDVPDTRTGEAAAAAGNRETRGNGERRDAGQAHRLGDGPVSRLIATCAGALGVNPEPFTLRELYAMYIERGIYDWRRTTALLTMIYTAATGRRSELDGDSMNLFLLLKNGKTTGTLKRLSLSGLANAIPGIKVIDKRQKSNAGKEGESQADGQHDKK
jgi:hypothetical protein